MNYERSLKDLFESITDYRKLVLLIFLIQNDKDLLKECGILKGDITRLFEEFEKFLMEEKDEYLDHIKNGRKSNIETILNKYLE